VKVTLTNVGTMPKDGPWAIIFPLEGREGRLIRAAFVAAAIADKDTDLSPSLGDQIIAHTVLLGPAEGNDFEGTFKATDRAR